MLKNAKKKIKKYKKKRSYDICPKCKKKKLKSSEKCFSCQIQERIKEEKKKVYDIISREELKNLIRIKSFSEIGQIYNVSDNTIRKWCKKYDLPFRKFDIEKYSNEEWENEIWDLKNLKPSITTHKCIKPSYNELKQDLYNLTKIKITEKYDYADTRYIDKIAQEYDLIYDKRIIEKFSYDEWINEKWRDKTFLKQIIETRFKANYPHREEIKNLIRKNSVEKIGVIYDLQEETIIRICKYFNFPYLREDILSYTDEEWEHEIWNNPSTTEKEGQTNE